MSPQISPTNVLGSIGDSLIPAPGSFDAPSESVVEDAVSEGAAEEPPEGDEDPFEPAGGSTGAADPHAKRGANKATHTPRRRVVMAWHLLRGRSYHGDIEVTPAADTARRESTFGARKRGGLAGYFWSAKVLLVPPSGTKMTISSSR